MERGEALASQSHEGWCSGPVVCHCHAQDGGGSHMGIAIRHEKKKEKIQHTVWCIAITMKEGKFTWRGREVQEEVDMWGQERGREMAKLKGTKTNFFVLWV